MTLCRKCGKEIPDGDELCEECQSTQEDFDEEYLTELIQNMEAEMGESEKPVAEDTPGEFSMEDLSLDDLPLGDILPDDDQPGEIQEELAEESLEDESMQQESGEQEPEEQESLEELPIETVQSEDVAAAEEPGEEDIDELLSMLSQDYESFDEPAEKEEEPQMETLTEDLDESPVEASLFSNEDQDDGMFADDIDALSVNDIFDDALSAVDYSEAEDETQEEVSEEFVSPDAADLSEGLEDALDSLALDGDSQPEGAAGVAATPMADPLADNQDKKDSFWKRIFGNIITEQTAEEEAREREEEQATAEQKAQVREEKKKQAAEEKAEKAEQTKALKEQKAAAKAEKAAVKEAEKEEKKRLKAEREANEVVGRINPVGASIVMVFFGVLCVLVIIGTQSLSYTSSVRGAESSFDVRDYRNAYESLAGVDVSESSQEMKDKVRICMQLQRGLDGFQNYYEMKMYLEALDSLMKGIRSYDDNKGKAEDYDILGQYNELEAKLAKQLYDEFGVTESQARSINSMETQEEYTSRLENIITQWELRNREDER